MPDHKFITVAARSQIHHQRDLLPPLCPITILSPWLPDLLMLLQRYLPPPLCLITASLFKKLAVAKFRRLFPHILANL